MELVSSLLDIFRSGSSAWDELMPSFNEIYATISIDDQLNLNKPSKRCRYFAHFMCTATEHNHTSLVTQILLDARCDLHTAMDGLFVAIRRNNLELVDLFLQSRFLFNLLTTHDVPSNDKKFVLTMEGHEIVHRELLSAIEYSCLCDHREILKRFLAYDSQRDRCQCRERDTFNQSDHTKEYHTIPLHAVIKLVKNDTFRKMLTLPAIIQLILDTGVDVNTLHLCRCTTLHLLIDEVDGLLDRRANDTPDVQQMLIDGVSTLLAAGSHTMVVSDKHGVIPIIETLLGLSIESLHSNHSYNKTINTILKIFVTHRSFHLPTHEIDSLFSTIFHESLRCMDKIDKHDAAGKDTSKYRTVMNGIAEVFGFFSLFYPDVGKYFYSYNAPLKNSGAGNYCERSNRMLFDEAFLRIARYSFEPGHTDKYIRLLINSMSAGLIQHFRNRLRGKKPFNRKLKDTKLQRRAFEFLNSYEGRFSLEQLSRRAITRAMSYRCLDVEKVSTLGLPKHVEEELLQYIE